MLQLVAYCRALGARGRIFRSFSEGANTSRGISNWDGNATFRCSVSGAWANYADSAYGTISCMNFKMLYFVGLVHLLSLSGLSFTFAFCLLPNQNLVTCALCLF